MAPGPRLVVGLAQLNGFQEITQLGHSIIRKPNQKMLYLSYLDTKVLLRLPDELRDEAVV